MRSLKDHIEDAIKARGSQTKLAEAMGCSQQQISYLLKAKTVTAEMAIKIDKATGGAVSRHDLRPDVFGVRPRAKASAA